MKANDFSIGRWIGALALVTATCSALVVACSDDATTTTDAGTTATDAATSTDTSTPAPEVAARVQVTYNGPSKGPLISTLFSTPMPSGNPAGVGSNEKPTWPGTNAVEMKNVLPGKYYAFAYIMVGPEHRMGPIDGDPNGPPVEVTVTAGQTATVNLTLFDAPPPDGGTDAPSGDASTDAPADGG